MLPSKSSCPHIVAAWYSALELNLAMAKFRGNTAFPSSRCRWSDHLDRWILMLNFEQKPRFWTSSDLPEHTWSSTGQLSVIRDQNYITHYTLNNVIRGGIGSTSGRNFYMGMQNASKLKDWRRGLLIHASELKLWHFEVFPYISIGKPYICNVFRPRTTWVGVATRTHGRDDLYPISSKLQYRVPSYCMAHV